MRIALISSEFAGVAHAGGIGTYMRSLADMMLGRGHEVEVFTAGPRTATDARSDGLVVNSVECHVRGEFAELIAPIFMDRHRRKPFDVAEGPEFLAETASVAREAPEVPLVLKLHTPAALMPTIDGYTVPAAAKLRFMAAGLMRGRLNRPFWRYHRAGDIELDNLATASEITAPCRAMVTFAAPYWNLGLDDVAVLPNIFLPPPELLAISPETSTARVTFVGRLEIRKGALLLPEIIRRVLDEAPEATFRLVGRSLPHGGLPGGMREHILRQIKGYEGRVEFVEGVPYREALGFYADTDVCVFPSMWENFPNVCLEAMAAARGVVGSSAGGMAEMLADGAGLVASPRTPGAIADAVLQLLRDPEQRMSMGRAARAKVLRDYGVEAIGPLQEASYARAIRNKREGARPCAPTGPA